MKPQLPQPFTVCLQTRLIRAMPDLPWAMHMAERRRLTYLK